MTIQLNAIAYSPVRHDYDDRDIWVASTQDVEVDQDVIDIFCGYLSEITYKRDMGQVAVGQFSSTTRADSLFNQILDLELDIQGNNEDYGEFETVSQSFATRLAGEMDGSSSSGVLFTISASENSRPFIGLLKLDLEEEATVSVLDRDTRELRSESLEDVLPEPDQLQKGCIHPVLDVENFNLTGDVKFLQKDSQADYFEDFLGCISSSGSLDQVRNVLETIDDLKEQYTQEGLSQDEISEFDQRTRDEDLITTDQVKDVAEDILEPHYDEDDFERKLYEAGEDEIVADPTNAPQHVKFTIDGDIEVKAPMSALDEDRLQIQEPQHLEDEWVITIRGSDTDRSFQE